MKLRGRRLGTPCVSAAPVRRATESENRGGLRGAAAVQPCPRRAGAMNPARRQMPRKSLVPISIAEYIPLHLKSNPEESRATLEAALRDSLEGALRVRSRRPNLID